MSSVDDTWSRVNGVELNAGQMDTVRLTSADTTKKVWMIRGYRITLVGALLAVTAALIIIAALMTALYAMSVTDLQHSPPRTARSSTSCTSSECIQQAAFMLSCMNASADPCQDFYQFACGGFNRNHPRGSRTEHNTGHVFTDYTAARLQDLLEAKWDSSAIGKARQFFRECVHAKRNARDFTSELVRLIGSYGGMDIIGSWDQTEWNIDIVVRLLNSKHAVNPFFHVIQLPSKEYAISYPSLPFTTDLSKANMINHTKPDYRDSIAQVLSLVVDPLYYSTDMHVASTCNATCIKQAAQDITDTEAEILKLIENNGGIVSTSNVDKFSRFDPEEIRKWGEEYFGELDTHVVVPLENITSIIDGINITALLQDMYGVDPISHKTRVQIPSVQYLKDINELLTSKKPLIRQYLMWVLIREFIPILGPRYEELKDKVTDDLGFWDNAQYSQDTISEQCLSLLDKFMPSTISAILAYKGVELHQIQQVETFAKESVDIFQDFLVWLGKEYHDKVLDSLKNITVSQKQSSSDIINISSLNQYYDGLELNDTDFFNIVKRLEEFIMKNTVRGSALKKTFEEHHRELLNRKMRYDYMSRTLYIPHALVQVPWYSYNLPGYINAGGIGFQLYTTLLHQLFYSRDNLLTGESFTQAYIDERYEVMGEFTKCMLTALTMTFKQIQKKEHLLGLTKYDFLSYPLGLRELFVDLVAIMAMEMSYRLHQRMKSPQCQRLPGFEHFTSDQMFFLAHEQTFCTNIRPSLALNLRRTVHTTSRLIVTGSREYQQAFNCVNKPRPFSRCSYP